MQSPIKIFISYSHQDKKYLEKDSLLGFLKGLEQEISNSGRIGK
ncbi:MAG: hypothetical protein ABSB19_17160 [Methylomonas sp.]